MSSHYGKAVNYLGSERDLKFRRGVDMNVENAFDDSGGKRDDRPSRRLFTPYVEETVFDIIATCHMGASLLKSKSALRGGLRHVPYKQVTSALMMPELNTRA